MARETRKTISWRRWLLATAAVAASAGVALAGLKVHNFAMAAPQFTFSAETPGALAIEGARNTSRERIRRVFDVDFGRSVFAVPLGERRRRLLAIDWVAEASLARIWPNRLIVEIKERAPVAFVNLPVGNAAARVLLIDVHGALMEPPARARFPLPVLAGVTELDPESVRAARVRAMLRFLEELGPRAMDISEVNTADPDNLRAVTRSGGRAVELQMGDGNYGRRYQAFLANFPEIVKRSPRVKVLDLRLDGRITTTE